MLKLLPGDPVQTILGNGAADPVKVAALRDELGLDRPFLTQYATWAGRFLTGDFGRTYNQGEEPVRTVILRNIPVTLELAVLALTLALLISIPLGVLAAYRSGSRLDRLISVGNYAALSAPAFVIGPVLIYFVGLRLGWLPVGQFTPWGDGPIDHIRSLILPAVTLAIAQVPNFCRILRTDMESTLKEDYITLAKTKGLSDIRILALHAMRPSSLTLMTVAAVNLGGLISGAVVVERLFNLPGLGFLLLGGIAQREYLLVLGVVTVITIVILLLGTGVDLLYGVVDPRVRTSRALG